MKKIIQITLLLSFALLIACTTTDEKYYSKTRHTPTSPNQVQILAEYPDRPYLEIGEVKAKGNIWADSGDFMSAIRDTGAEMGADAVVVIGNAKTEYNYWDGVHQKKKAIAIKWTAPEGTKIQKQEIPTAPSNSLPTPQPIN